MTTSKKTKTQIVWPEGHFTINDVQATVPEMINITLRFRIKRAVETKVIRPIGKIKPPIGRPMLVFAKNPVANEVIEKAMSSGVLPLENDTATTKVKVVDVKSTQTVSTEATTEKTAEVSDKVTTTS